eukprot:1107572-Rhodomonas_salina.1
MFAVFQSFSDEPTWARYNEFVKCAEALQLEQPLAPSGGTTGSQGLYYAYPFSLYEIPFAWWFKCSLLSGIDLSVPNKLVNVQCEAWDKRRDGFPQPAAPSSSVPERYVGPLIDASNWFEVVTRVDRVATWDEAEVAAAAAAKFKVFSDNLQVELGSNRYRRCYTRMEVDMSSHAAWREDGINECVMSRDGRSQQCNLYNAMRGDISMTNEPAFFLTVMDKIEQIDYRYSSSLSDMVYDGPASAAAKLVENVFPEPPDLTREEGLKDSEYCDWVLDIAPDVNSEKPYLFAREDVVSEMRFLGHPDVNSYVNHLPYISLGAQETLVYGKVSCDISSPSQGVTYSFSGDDAINCGPVIGAEDLLQYSEFQGVLPTFFPDSAQEANWYPLIKRRCRFGNTFFSDLYRPEYDFPVALESVVAAQFVYDNGKLTNSAFGITRTTNSRFFRAALDFLRIDDSLVNNPLLNTACKFEQ